MSSINSQTAGSGHVSIWTVVLSSSVLLATITGVFYFVGGASYEGYSQALGLYYLAGWQPTEYIFAGAELLMTTSAAPWLWLAMLLVSLIPASMAKRRYFSHTWESLIFALLGGIPTLLVLLFVIYTMKTSRDLITHGACPITGTNSILGAWLVCVATIAFTAMISQFFFTRLLRLMFLSWGMIIALLCLYNFGWAAGAARLYESFQVAEIDSPFLSAGADTKVLVLRADDKNLAVIVRGENRTGHPEPRYLLRSEIKTFRIVGTSSINDFFCKRLNH
jgi:hypothetical protein